MAELYFLGIDIGGTKCAVIIGKKKEDSVEIAEKTVFPTAEQGGCEAVIKKIAEEGKKLLKKNNISPESLGAVGVSCGGPLDGKRGLILSPPNLPGWDKVPIVKILEKEFGVPAGLQNDADACALAEFGNGAGKGCENLIFLTFGTGMGAGLILNGKLYSGSSNMAGEVGHIRLERFGPVGYGKSGSFEGFCSGGGIKQLAEIKKTERLQRGEAFSIMPSSADGSVSAKDVALAARSGNPDALEIIRECAEHLGRALSILIDILNPEVIVIGSIYARNPELFDDIIRDVIKKECLPASAEKCRIVPAALGDSLGDYAALYVAENAYRSAKQILS